MLTLIWIAGFVILFIYLKQLYARPLDLSRDDRIARSLTAEAALELIRDRSGTDDFILLDVRTGPEHQAGAIAGSTHLDFCESSFVKNVNDLDRNRTYLLYCASGARSRSALKLFAELQFREVYELAGGYTAYLTKNG